MISKFLLLAIAFLLGMGQAPMGGRHPDAQHNELYDQNCCNKADCEPIPDTAIKEGAKGYEVEYMSAKFGLVKGVVPYGQEKMSHGCVGNMCQHACARPRYESIPGCKYDLHNSCSRASTTLPADVGCLYVNQMW